MTERAKALAANAQAQITQLTNLLTRLDESALRRPCPGREKLGDGTIGAAIRHTADNYRRIAGFVKTGARAAQGHQPEAPGGHRIPKFVRAFGHRSPEHAPRNHGDGQHEEGYSADNIDLRELATQLNASRDALGRIAELTDRQLDQVPPKGSFRFCDGQRTVEQVLTGLLKHQAHQLEALSSSA